MLILVYGSKGWIGTQFINILKKNNIIFVEGLSRVDNEADIYNEIDKIKPTNIISFIGRTHGLSINTSDLDSSKDCDKSSSTLYTTIDYLEHKDKLLENIRDNLYSPILLADICYKKNIHYTYLGTGCIFQYDINHPSEKEENGFTEESLPNFYGSSYSVVKGFTDRIMKFYKTNILNLRIRMPLSDENNHRNFITKLINYKKICSISNSMTVLSELLPYVLDMMQNKTIGTFNLTNPGLISHNEILEMYKEIVDNNFSWENFSIEEQHTILKSERSNNYLNTTKLQLLYPNIKNIKDSVKECLIKYKSNLKYELSSLTSKEVKQIINYNTNSLSEINLLITGGCGFIGSNFINYYFPKQKINKLINIDALYYCANINNIEESIRNNSKYIFIEGNLCNEELINTILNEHNITHIIHFAAQTHVNNSFIDSLSFTKDNILCTHILLEKCKKYGKIKKFIHVSTDEVYGESMNTIDEKYKTEHSILCPTNPYAATKASAELIAQSYKHSYKLPIIITRCNNVYGPNQYYENLIPCFIKLLKENKKVCIQGNGTAIRGFIYVLDIVKAFEKILCYGNIGEIYNIGCNKEMEFSINDVQ
jgi:dTDP-glucose 4,6-dehydratase